jgi:hypothetical protein
MYLLWIWILSPLLSIEVKQWLPLEETSDFRFREALEATLKEKSEAYWTSSIRRMNSSVATHLL